MKKYFKRFLAVFPAVLILILNIIPFSVSASSVPVAIPNRDDMSLYPEDYFIRDDEQYFIINCIAGDHCWSYCFISDDYEYYCDDSIMTINFHNFKLTLAEYSRSKFYDTRTYDYYIGDAELRFDVEHWRLRQIPIFDTDFPTSADLFSIYTNFNNLAFMPDIQVEFNPNLSGTVDRRVSNGTNTSLLQDLNFTITNYSKFAVQYKLWIDMKNPVTSRNGEFDSSDKKGYYETHFDDDPVFVYYSNERVYSVIDTESASGMFSPQNVALFDKPSEWHYLKAGETFSEVFPFAMINLTEGTDYVVHVWVNKCDYDHPSTNLMTSEDTPAQEGYPANPNYKEVDQKYRYHFDSDFSMLQYSDVKYDPTIKAGSSLPYDGSKGISNQEQYRYMYDAKTDLITGETNIGHVDLYNDPHSWVNKNYVYSPSYISSGSSSFKFSNLLASTSSFFSFFSAVLGYFPPILLEVVSLALLSFLTIAIIRRIH